MSPQDENRKIILSAVELADVALSTIRAVIGKDQYQYLSGPITGGRRLLDWHEAEGRGLEEAHYRKVRESAVIQPNIETIKAAAERERAECRSTIEPGSFEAKFPHWGQDDFLNFWERVIKEHAQNVRFMPGWEFSSGCAFEYLCALRHDRPTIDVRGTELPATAALVLLENSLAEIAARHDPKDPRDEPIVTLHSKIRMYRDQIGLLA